MTDIARLTISLSGPDNIGKTTLLSLFPRTWPLEHVGGIPLFDPVMHAMITEGSLGTWWFGPLDIDGQLASLSGGASDDEFVQTILQACTARLEVAQGPGHADGRSKSIVVGGQTFSLPGSVLDRSSVMFEAVCVARIALRNSITVSEAEQRLSVILASKSASFPTETIRLLLRRAGTFEDAVEWCLKEEERSTPVTQVYRQYQLLLHEALERQVAAGRYTFVITRKKGETFMETLGKLTEALQRLCGVGNSWTPLLQNLRCCPAFGGLSECGKSTVATTTVSSAFFSSNGGAFRLKIGYLLELAGARLGRHIYDLPEDKQALELVHELDRFSRAHRWLKVITLESLHSYELTRRLRELIGNGVPGELSNTLDKPTNSSHSSASKLLVVYLDTPLELRCSRTEAQGGRFDASKDEVKRSRGADRIRDIADLVVDNGGEFSDTCEEVNRAVARFGV